MAIASAAFAPSPPMDPTDKQKYRTRLASAGTTTGSPMNLHVSVGAHNLRILKKAGGGNNHVAVVETPRGSAATTPTGTSKQRKYERKSKRFLWPDELHRLFVAAIFDIGLKNASPKALLSIMSGAGASSDLTTEHLKSHLQKYRLNYERSRLEFLEFYDESARRSHKRRRKSASRSSSSDHNNTAFVFPISHKRQRSGGDGDGSSDDSGSGSDATSDMEDESAASPSESVQETTTRNAAELAPSAQPDVNVKVEVLRRRSSPSPATKGRVATQRQSSEPPTPTYAASIQPYQPAVQPKATSVTGSVGNGMADGISDRMVAAAAAAAVASVPFGGLSTLNDPQWNILNSLISPQLMASRSPAEGGPELPGGTPGISLPSTGTATSGKVAGALEPFSLSGAESADLQMQMHMAMQAQMNLHRQMLTRKVEVSQHLHNQQQEQPGSKPVNQEPLGTTQHTSAWNSGIPPTSKAANAATSTSQAQPTLLPDMPHARAVSGSLENSSASFAMNATSATFSQATTVSSVLASAAPSTVESTVSTTLLGLQGSDFADAAALASLEAVGPSDKMEGEGLADLYRWDKMDFSMDIDDDDLFGFLKS